MKSLWMPLVAVLGLVMVAGCSDPTAGKTAAVVGDAAEEAPAESGSPDAPTPEPGIVYTFADDTAIFFEGYKVTGAHNGEFLDIAGNVTVPGEDITKARVQLTIDMTTFEADEAALTDKLKSADFFEVETYPESRFVSTAIAKTDSGYNVSGNLTMKGTTKNITFPADIQIDGDTLTASAEFTIKRFDWNINYKGLADDLIKDEVLLVFEVEAIADETAQGD
jgi:polyisoprenoid-binding protein YceI